MLYGCDGAWWKQNRGVPDFQGLKVSQDENACTKFSDLRKVSLIEECDDLLVKEPGRLGAGGNSGFQAVNLVVQFGVSRIILIGFDMRIDRGIHWHGPHGKGLGNPREDKFVRWRHAFGKAAGTLAGLGVEVINASPDSTLTIFPRMSFKEALAQW